MDPIKGKIREVGLVTLMDGTEIKGLIVEIGTPPPGWTFDAIFDGWEIKITKSSPAPSTGSAV
jgi:hypothetical protein